MLAPVLINEHQRHLQTTAQTAAMEDENTGSAMTAMIYGAPCVMSDCPDQQVDAYIASAMMSG